MVGSLGLVVVGIKNTNCDWFYNSFNSPVHVW
jgi:hypothetical protein